MFVCDLSDVRNQPVPFGLACAPSPVLVMIDSELLVRLGDRHILVPRLSSSPKEIGEGSLRQNGSVRANRTMPRTMRSGVRNAMIGGMSGKRCLGFQFAFEALASLFV